MISATTLLNLYAELFECCTKTKTQSVGDCVFVSNHRRGFSKYRYRRLLIRPLPVLRLTLEVDFSHALESSFEISRYP